MFFLQALIVHAAIFPYTRYSCYTETPAVFNLGIAIDQSALDFNGVKEQDALPWLQELMVGWKKVYKENFNIELKVVSVMLPSQYSFLRERTDFSHGRCPRGSYTWNTHKVLNTWNWHCQRDCPVNAVAWHLIIGGNYKCIDRESEPKVAPGMASGVGYACTELATSVSLSFDRTEKLRWIVPAHELGHQFGPRNGMEGIMRGAKDWNKQRVPLYSGPVQFSRQDGEKMCGDITKVRTHIWSGGACNIGQEHVPVNAPDVFGQQSFQPVPPGAPSLSTGLVPPPSSNSPAPTNPAPGVINQPGAPATGVVPPPSSTSPAPTNTAPGVINHIPTQPVQLNTNPFIAPEDAAPLTPEQEHQDTIRWHTKDPVWVHYIIWPCLAVIITLTALIAYVVYQKKQKEREKKERAKSKRQGQSRTDGKHFRLRNRPSEAN